LISWEPMSYVTQFCCCLFYGKTDARSDGLEHQTLTAETTQLEAMGVDVSAVEVLCQVLPDLVEALQRCRTCADRENIANELVLK
jgi:hypothetical protein